MHRGTEQVYQFDALFVVLRLGENDDVYRGRLASSCYLC